MYTHVRKLKYKQIMKSLFGEKMLLMLGLISPVTEPGIQEQRKVPTVTFSYDIFIVNSPNKNVGTGYCTYGSTVYTLWLELSANG